MEQKLTLIERVGKLDGLYLCSCWNKCIKRLCNVMLWLTKSCWCIRKLMKLNTTHWLSHTKIYNTYISIKQRCNNINNKRYNDRWGRWIKCLWKSFEEFRDDMYDSMLDHIKEYGEKETTIDRIDNDWNYCKENCRWATHSQQNSNIRKSYREYNWIKKTLWEWAKLYNCSKLTIHRYCMKWVSFEEIKTKWKYRTKGQLYCN